MSDQQTFANVVILNLGESVKNKIEYSLPGRGGHISVRTEKTDRTENIFISVSVIRFFRSVSV